jgi:hypothetical protein
MLLLLLPLTFLHNAPRRPESRRGAFSSHSHAMCGNARERTIPCLPEPEAVDGLSLFVESPHFKHQRANPFDLSQP